MVVKGQAFTMSEGFSEHVRAFLIDHVDNHPRDLVSLTAEKFGVTRQAVHRHLRKLVKEGVIEAKGTTRNKVYALAVSEFFSTISLKDHPEEDQVWRLYMEPKLNDLPENILRICYYGFTEMINNAIDHSEGSSVTFGFGRSWKNIDLFIKDDGVGIFEKIKQRFGLQDRRQAILELSKGKLTTDPRRHSGQGIFFTSRMFDKFYMFSDDLGYSHKGHESGWLIDSPGEAQIGTGVIMKISLNSKLTPKEVFDQFTDLGSDDYDFSKTHVPMRLARYGREDLVSRSQAKRVLSGFERFKEVLLDFAGVDQIGQAFADEIFRVYARSHPGIELMAINANEDVTRMIRRAQSALKVEGNHSSAPA